MIKIKIKRNDPCPCGSNKKYKKCCFLNKRPRKGILRLAYNMRTNDLLMARIFFQILQIRDFVYHDKENKERKNFDDRYNSVFQNLYEVRLAKERCEQLIKEHSEKIKSNKICEYSEKEGVIKINECIDNELNMAFKDFFIRGNIALRDLVKVAVFMGYNISFVFINSKKKKYLKKRNKFMEKNTEDKYLKFVEMIEDDKKQWYSIFIEIRDKIEHEGLKIPEVNYVLDKDDRIKPLYPTMNNQKIEDLLAIFWTNLFHFCEDIMVNLLSFKLKDPFIIGVIPKDKRDPKNLIKYKVTIKI